MTTGFTRQETLKLTGITSGKLAYLDEIGMVSPRKIGNPKRPKVIYSIDQVIDLMVFSKLRDRLSFREVCKVVQFIRGRNYSQYLFYSPLAYINGELFVITSWEAFGLKVLATAKECKGRVAIKDCGVIGDVFAETRENADRGNVLDFEKRIRGTVLNYFQEKTEQ
jgi:hypothetical protein